MPRLAPRRCSSPARPAHAAKVTECTKIGICYCVNDEHKAAIDAKVDQFRQILAEQRKAGKAVGYLSVPLTSAGGGNFNVNKEVAESAKVAIEKRLRRRLRLRAQSRHARRRPARGSTRRRLHGDVDDAARGYRRHSATSTSSTSPGPQDFARYFGFDGNDDMAKLDAFFDKRVQVRSRVREGRARAASPSRRSAATTRCARRRP